MTRGLRFIAENGMVNSLDIPDILADSMSIEMLMMNF